MLAWLLRIARDDSGQDVVEYALLDRVLRAGCARGVDRASAMRSALSYGSTTSGVQGLWDPPPPSGS